MCGEWRNGLEEWERGVASGSDDAKGWVLSEKGVVGRMEDGGKDGGRSAKMGAMMRKVGYWAKSVC